MDTSLLSIVLVVCVGGAVLGGAVVLGGMGDDGVDIPIPEDGLGTPYDSSGDAGGDDGGSDTGLPDETGTPAPTMTAVPTETATPTATETAPPGDDEVTANGTATPEPTVSVWDIHEGSSDDNPLPTTRTVTDMAGHTVTIPYNVNRIVTLYAPAAAMVMAIDDGSAARLVGVDGDARDDTGFNAIDASMAGKTVVIEDNAVNLETLLSVNPDVIIAKTCLPVSGLDGIDIPVVWIDTSSLETVDGALTLLGDVMGKPTRAAQLVSYIDGKQAVVADVVSTIPEDNRDGLYLSGSTPTYTFAGGKFHEEWSSATGCNLVSADLPSLPYKPQVSVEQITTWNPDLILLSNSLDPASVLTDETWASIAAVENNRVYRIPRFVGDWASPVPESTLGLMWVTNGTYHEYLDLDMVEETKAFYDTFYSYAMTDDEALTIMGAFPALHGREITDMKGINVVIPYDVTKVVTLYPPAAAMVMAIDGGSADSLVGITHDAITDEGFNDIDPSIAGKTEITFTDNVPNQETILLLDPDVIITKTCMPYSGFEDLGIPVVWIDTTHVEQIDGALTLIGEVLEKPDRATTLTSYIQGKRASLALSIPSVDPERLYLSGGSPLATFAGGKFHEEWADGAGCVLVSAGTSFSTYKPTVSIETIIGWDPEIIMLSNTLDPSTVLLNSAWQNITAVQNGRVYRVPRYVGDWASPVPESTLGMMLVANGTYTEVDLDMIQETQDFYTLFYNHALSDAEVIDIIGTPAPAPAPIPI